MGMLGEKIARAMSNGTNIAGLYEGNTGSIKRFVYVFIAGLIIGASAAAFVFVPKLDRSDRAAEEYRERYVEATRDIDNARKCIGEARARLATITGGINAIGVALESDVGSLRDAIGIIEKVRDALVAMETGGVLGNTAVAGGGDYSGGGD
jgi:hypothetical protein